MRLFIAVLCLFSFCSCANPNVKQDQWQPSQTPAEIPAYTPKITNSYNLNNKPTVTQDTWQLRQSQDGIPVYTRKVAGSPILEYKANIIIDAPISKAIALFEDEKKISRWYFQCVHSELVERDGPKQEIIYLVLHLPWPVAPRDFVFKRARTEDPKNGTISYTLTALPDRLPAVKGMIRVRTIRSIWRFKSLPKGQTELYFQQHTDPAGSIPYSIINQLAVQTPFYSLKNFRDLLK